MKMAQGRTVGAKVWLLTTLLLGCLVAIGGISVWNLKALSDHLSDATEVQLPAVRYMTLADMMHDGIRATVFHSIIVSGSKNEKEIKETREESEEFAKNIQQYMDTIGQLSLGPEVKASVASVKPKVVDYVASAHALIELALSGKLDKAMADLPAFAERFEALEKDFQKLGDLIHSNAQTATKEAVEVESRAKTTSYLVILLSFAASLVFSFFIIRGLKASLERMISSLSAESKGVGSTAMELGQTARGLTESAANQASALQETASSLEQITAMVKKTSENSAALEKSAQTSHESASRGDQTTSEMFSAIESIAESNSKIMSQIEDGNKKISEIVKVIGEIGSKTKVINDIVFQTKLLSFNASVEAARAGEHGKGFAVVAEEVGNLAQMSGNAAKEISDMLDSSIRTVNTIVTENKNRVETLIADGRSKLDSGKDISRKCKESLTEIVNQSTEVSRLITEITTAIQEQNQGIQEISKALSLLDQNAHGNSMISQKTAETSSDLLSRSEKLQHVVHQLESMAVGGQGRGPAWGAQESPQSGARNEAQQGLKAHKAKTVDSEGFVDVDNVLEMRKKKKVLTPAPLKNVVGGESFPSEKDPRFQ